MEAGVVGIVKMLSRIGSKVSKFSASKNIFGVIPECEAEAVSYRTTEHSAEQIDGGKGSTMLCQVVIQHSSE